MRKTLISSMANTVKCPHCSQAHFMESHTVRVLNEQCYFKCPGDGKEFEIVVREKVPDELVPAEAAAPDPPDIPSPEGEEADEDLPFEDGDYDEELGDAYTDEEEEPEEEGGDEAPDFEAIFGDSEDDTEEEDEEEEEELEDEEKKESLAYKMTNLVEAGMNPHAAINLMLERGR